MSSTRTKHRSLVIIAAALMVCLVLGAALSFVFREQILARYYVGVFVNQPTPPAHAAAWLQRHTGLSVPLLLSELSASDDVVNRRVGQLVRSMVAEQSDPTDPVQSHLALSIAARLHSHFDAFSVSGRIQAVQVAYEVLANQLGPWSPNVPTALETAGEVVLEGLRDESAAVAERALRQLDQVWDWDGSDDITLSLVADWKRQCYLQAVQSLEETPPGIRIAAVEAIVRAPFHEADPQLIDMLSEDDPKIQKPALLALANAADDHNRVSAADSLSAAHKRKLIAFLHDPDPDVREAVRRLLVASGLTEGKIRLATLIRHPDPAERAKVVNLAFSVEGIDAVEWLLELSRDSSPAVRLAAARAASLRSDPRLRKLLVELKDNDPDPNVRDMAEQFLLAQSPGVPELK